MKASTPSLSFRRAVAIFVVITHIAACTSLPSGQKAFGGFNECIAVNLGIATVGGVAAGYLGKALAQKLTSNQSTVNKVAVAGGVAAAVAIGMVAWRKCAAAYSKSEVIAPASPPPPPTATKGPALAPSRRIGLTLDRLEVSVEGNEETAPAPEFSFTYNGADANEKDVKAVFRHKVDIVRFKSTDDGKLILTDDRDQPLKDNSGHPIPLEMAPTMPRGRLSWTPIAAEGQQDYVEDVVIQQGPSALYQHKLQIPPRAQLPLPLPVPMRYKLTIEVAGQTSSRSVDFLILRAAGRPKRFLSSAAVNTGETTPSAAATSSPTASPPTASSPRASSPRVSATAASSPKASSTAASYPKASSTRASSTATASTAAASTVAASTVAASTVATSTSATSTSATSTSATSATTEEDDEFTPTHTVRHRVMLFNQAASPRKTVGFLNAGTPVEEEEEQDIQVGSTTFHWVKVATEDGPEGLVGWLRSIDLEPIK